MREYLLIFDHGTTGIKTCIMDRQGNFRARAYARFEQFYPKPAWVEHDPQVLWDLTLSTAADALLEADIGWSDIHAIGISNQRETSILWDAQTDIPVCRAIVWQCRRTEGLCAELKAAGHEPTIQAKTGLVLDPYFSASKIRWMLDEHSHARALRDRGQLRFGTVDTWIAWKLSGGASHITDYSNASRTMLLDIHKRSWDPELMSLFGVTSEMLPSLEGECFTDPSLTGGVRIPIAALVGDQQAALYGQRCWSEGEVKSTYGTGTFVMLNLGDSSIHSGSGLLTTLAYNAEGSPCYALEGSVFLAGGILEWLQNSLGVIRDGKHADELAQSLISNEGVYMVPAMAGLGAPYWRPDARGVISGLSQSSGPAHLARAALEAMVYQSKEVLDLMISESGIEMARLRVDGGVSRSPFLMQFLADMIDAPVQRLDSPDITARGAGLLAGLRSGFWASAQELSQLGEEREEFCSKMDLEQREELFSGWKHAITGALSTRSIHP